MSTSVSRIGSDPTVIQIVPLVPIKEEQVEEQAAPHQVENVSNESPIHEMNRAAARRTCVQIIKHLVGDRPFGITKARLEEIKVYTGYTTEQVEKEIAIIKNDQIRALVGDRPFVTKADDVEKIKKATGCTTEELMDEIIAIGKPLADPPISNFRVSLAGLGKSGDIYLGVNLEFPEGGPLNQTVHAEQFMLVNARNEREASIEKIRIFAAPCGHCRQYINEIGEKAKDIVIEIPDGTFKFSELLPYAFGPHDLGLEGGLLTHQPGIIPSELPDEFPLKELAIAAAEDSYAPYSKDLSGVAIRTKDGRAFTGSYLENAAFNPSLSPLQTALVALKAAGKAYEEISEVVFVEYKRAKVKHSGATMDILGKIAPQAIRSIYYREDQSPS